MQDPSLFQQINPRLPEHEQSNCPRCDSENTKFCYYNNYNLSQPRHYCKNCRRYWTKGGTIRNIPIGGGIRKPTKRGSSSSKESSKSQPLDENQVDQDRRIPRTEGLNLNVFAKDLTLGLDSGSDIRNPEVEMQIGDNASRLSAFDENGENWQRLE